MNSLNKQKKLMIGLVFLLSVFVHSVFGVQLVLYNQNGFVVSSNPAIDAFGLAIGVGISQTSLNPKVYDDFGGFVLNRDNQDYIQFGLKVTDTPIKLTNLRFRVDRSSNGPQYYTLDISTNGGQTFNPLTSGVIPLATITQNVILDAQPVISSPNTLVLFRLYGYNAINSTGTLALDNTPGGWAIEIEGEPAPYVQSIFPEYPTILNPTSFIQTQFSEVVTVDSDFMKLYCVMNGEIPLRVATNLSQFIQVYPYPVGTMYPADDVCKVVTDLSKVTDLNGTSGIDLIPNRMITQSFQIALKSSTPFDGEVAVLPTTNIVIEYNKPVFPPGSVSGGLDDFVDLVCGGIEFSGLLTLDSPGQAHWDEFDTFVTKGITIQPSVDLPLGVSCTVTLNGVEDSFDNSVLDNTISFNTVNLGDILMRL